MVLALPILLFVMALMINFGTVASWKVRGWLAARHEVWQSRWPRNVGNSPRPDYWPQTASMSNGGAGDVNELDHPAVDRPVVRGPMLYNTRVNEDLLDPVRGLRQGSSNMTRSFPLLSSIGDYHLPTETRLLDNKWQFQRFGLSSTQQRRIPVIYSFEPADAAYAQAYVAAALDILYAPFRPDLFPLDRDDEFIGYSRRFGWGSGAPEFHPDLGDCCRLDDPGDCCHDAINCCGGDHSVPFCCRDRRVVQELVDDLVDHIQGGVELDADGNVVRRIPSVAEVMTRAFIRLYRRVIRELEDLINFVPPPPPSEIAAMQAEIRDLEDKIAVLEAYLNRLRASAQNSP